MFGNLLQPTHLVIVLVIALLIFGPSKIGELGGSIGKSIKEFKKAISHDDTDKADKTGTNDQSRS